MERMLGDWGIPYDDIYVGEGKPGAAAYVDDRGLTFENNWLEIARKIIDRG
jgi:hypothetical protein